MLGFAAVIFDMDGLLLDSERVALEMFRQTCVRFELGDQTDVYMKCVGVNSASGSQILEAAFGHKIDCLEFQRIWDEAYHLRISSAPIPVKAGVVELLAALGEANIPTAVATSTRRERAKLKLEQAGLFQYFKEVVGGDQVERSKPYPDIYLRAAALLQAEPRQCLALEDSENGVRAALAAGMTVVQVPDLVQPSDALKALGHHIVTDLSEVIPLLAHGAIRQA